jgi:transposase-like protein
MNTKLLSPEPDPSIEEEEERNDTKAAKDLEQEIECPRCYDVMTLSSNFDSIRYVCHECDFLLVMK